MANNLFTNAEDEYINTWISENYCKNNWKFAEGIREILQNQMDGIVSKVGKKGDIKIVPDKTKVKNGLCYEFDFINQNTKLKSGIIRYEGNYKRLIIQNDGELETGDLLLGGTKDILDQKDIIAVLGKG